jgi:hypothetical protein
MGILKKPKDYESTGLPAQFLMHRPILQAEKRMGDGDRPRIQPRITAAEMQQSPGDTENNAFIALYESTHAPDG